MKEIQFIGKNKERWGEFEKKITNNSFQDIQEIAQTYSLLNEDLSYAQTNYPKSDITIYLNQLIQRSHQYIHQPKGEDKGRFLKFWYEEVPLVIWKHKNLLLTSIFIFLTCCCIGYYSGSQDANFARMIMGNSYIEQTLQNMEDGKPTGIYASHGRAESFLGITFNNIRVSFYAMAAGVFFIVGTVFLLIQNGIMVGVFQQFFVEQGHGDDFFYAVWMHGTIELWSIMIAGGAGIIIGKGLYFPGTYSRIESIKSHGKDAAKIIIGLIPFFIIAGFIEGFFTRIGPENRSVSLFIIISSVLLILFYFFYLPYKQHRKTWNSLRKEI
jgi:uncharacterized membrane protein SpoIIM required for sporulation